MSLALPGAYICTNKVTHARLLPTESAHRFTYPVISFLLSLSALEKGELDLGGGWLFGYGGLWLRATGIRSSAYLHFGWELDNKRSIKQKLLELLRSHALDPDLFDDAWILTMPSYFGFEGINPLTVYFCYKSDRSLWVVVLEVHNTFGERHVYVLPVGPEYQDTNTPSRYTHSWTFARQFHVSPFNDRSGFYTCSIVPPSHPPMGVDSDSWSPETLSSLEPSIRIDLYTSDPRTTCPLVNADGKVSSTKKLFAVLRPISRRPFTSKQLLHTLAKYPISLFLSFPLIAFEAARLHYFKGLDVYARPAPRAADLSVERSLATPSNPVQQDEKDARLQGGGVGWQPEGMLERYSRHLVEEFLHSRAQELDTQIKLVFADPSFGTHTFPCSVSTKGKSNSTLTIFVRSPQAFVFLFISPSVRHALALGQDSERQFSVSDEQMFMRVFGVQPFLSGSSLGRFAQRIRISAVPSRVMPASTTVPRVHFLDQRFVSNNQSVGTGREVANMLFLILFYFVLYIEKFVFTTIFHARFVPGDEPWNIWVRVEERCRSVMDQTT